MKSELITSLRFATEVNSDQLLNERQAIRKIGSHHVMSNHCSYARLPWRKQRPFRDQYPALPDWALDDLSMDRHTTFQPLEAHATRAMRVKRPPEQLGESAPQVCQDVGQPNLSPANLSPAIHIVSGSGALEAANTGASVPIA